MHHWQLRVFARMHCLPVQESGLVWSCRLTAWSRCFISCHSVEGMDKVDNEKGQENVLIFVTTKHVLLILCIVVFLLLNKGYMAKSGLR